MWILRKINNNCALARDSSGQDVVVFGKGIGFRRPPYELTDLSAIDRTFYDVRDSSLAALQDIPDDVVLLASNIIDHAKDVLQVEMNPNAPITLADHINYAIKRARDGLTIQTPLAFDVKHLYPKEMAIAKKALTIVKTRFGFTLPEAEQANIALHIIDAEAEKSDMKMTLATTEVVREVTGIIERDLDLVLDTESFMYARFVMHLRFLVGRVLKGEKADAKMAPMLEVMRDAYPESYACVQDILAYFVTRGWECDESEILYLLIHVQRLKNNIE